MSYFANFSFLNIYVFANEEIKGALPKRLFIIAGNAVG